MKLKVLSLAALLVLPATAQRRAVDASAAADQSAPRRTRLYLKDGTYQIVLSYAVKGKLVVFRSAERGGEEEEIPVELVDLVKTASWAQLNGPGTHKEPVLDPELAKEEADRSARNPEVALNLRLSDQESVMVLDTFQGTPNLVPLVQTDGDLNRQTAHNILRQSINPFAHAHQLIQIKGSRASQQMHVDTPEFFIRLDDGATPQDDTTGALQVDTHGASAADRSTSSQKSEYVIVRADVRQDVRIVSSFSINMLGGGKMERDVVETVKTVLPGGHWLKLVPKQPLLMGEYALIEVLNEKEVNMGVWDFGVHPTAMANRDAILPQERRKPSLAPRER